MLRVIHLSGLDVYRHLAVEEWLLDEGLSAGPFLLFYESDRAVVIGKNQNPWRECRLKRMADEGVALARRLSGGGAVYHGAGNLNYALVVPRDRYQQRRLFDRLIHQLRACGLSAALEKNLSLTVAGRKISGNAFGYRKQGVLHHGTLLWQADLAQLGRYLGGAVDGIETRAIESIPATVANITDFNPDLSRSQLVRAVETACAKALGEDPLTERLPIHPDAISDRWQALKSDAWLLERTPAFDWINGVDRMTVRRGRVASVSTNGAVDESLTDCLKGCVPDRTAIRQRLQSMGAGGHWVDFFNNREIIWPGFEIS